MKRNITLSLDTSTLKQAKQLAAGRNLSISKLLAEDLAARVASDRRYARAKRKALAWLEGGVMNMGGRYLSREATHERDR